MPGSTPARKLSTGRPVTPMSERQQMKLVRQLATSDSSPGTPPTPDGPKKPRRCNGRGETPLHRAAIRGDADLVKKLLTEGADPNAQDFAGWTALHEACNHGWLEVAEALLDAGADVNMKGFDDDTPLHDATGNAHIDLARLLVERGAEIQAVNRRGKTACDLAPPAMLPYLLHSDSIENEARNFGGNDTNATADMRRNKGDKSPRVTLKLHHIKKRAGKLNFDDLSNTTGQSKLCMDMEEKAKEDVYEFKTSSKEATPVRGSSTSPDVEKATVEAKAVESKPEESESVSLNKRPAVDHETEDADEEVKRKKKKEEGAKEVKAPTTASRLAAVRGVNATAKAQALTPTKTAVPAKPSTSVKSPGSPKGGGSGSTVPSPTGSKGEPETDGDGERLGPKVPPLKIVIPQSGGQEPEQGGPRNGKNNSTRHSALPYVVSSNSNDSEKDGSISPTDAAMSAMTPEEQKTAQHQRVLRSHRGGGEPPSRPTSAGSGSPPAVAANPVPAGTSQSSAEHSPAKPELTNPVTESPPPATSTTPPALDPIAAPASSAGSSKGSHPSTPGSGGDDKSPDTPDAPTPAPDIHPRKRKIKHRNVDNKEAPAISTTPEATDGAGPSVDAQTQEQPVKNCYQLYLDIRKQVERRRQSLFPVQPKPPQGFKDYLLNRGAYLLASNASTRQIPSSPIPQNLPPGLNDLFASQERERHKLRLQHIIEKEKLVLSVEQEILRVHGRAARALANQSVPFSVCTVLRDKEVYNLITPEQEEKDRNNARSRYNGRLFLGWLQDVDDKWEKIKENMLVRHHNEAESLHAVQKMAWEWKMVELGLCMPRPRPVISNSHVPIVHCSVDFDLLPA